MPIKHYLTFFGQCFYLDLIFQKRHFCELAKKLQKHVLYKYIIGTYEMKYRRRLEKREREKQGRGNDSCHISDQYFLPCFLCKHPAILFQIKNGIFQHKN